MRRRSSPLAIIGALAALLLAARSLPVVTAQTAIPNPNDGLDRTCETATGATCAGAPPLETTVGLLINSLLVILGFVFLIIIIFGGIQWMTAGGNEDKVAKAKTMIGAAIAGLVVIFISFALAAAIVTALSQASNTGQ